MKKFVSLLLALVLVLTTTAALADTITVGIVNNPPSESGYRQANVEDFERVFSAENGYEAKTFYSLKNDEQLQAAQQFITDGVDYLLISAAETTGWDAVLTAAQEAGVRVFLFDRLIDCDESLYEAAVVSDMAFEGNTAVAWLLALVLVLTTTVALADTITVGIVNCPPSESGYREANVKNFEEVCLSARCHGHDARGERRAGRHHHGGHRQQPPVRVRLSRGECQGL